MVVTGLSMQCKGSLEVPLPQLIMHHVVMNASYHTSHMACMSTMRLMMHGKFNENSRAREAAFTWLMQSGAGHCHGSRTPKKTFKLLAT
jgi:hypothetical protein